MLVVNREASIIRLLVTVSENTAASSSSYVLKLYSPYTKEDFTINLPFNSSPYPERYDEFILPVAAFDGLAAGKYNYTINEATDGVVEQGVLIVTDTNQDAFQSLTPEATDDDFLTYNPSL